MSETREAVTQALKTTSPEPIDLHKRPKVAPEAPAKVIKASGSNALSHWDNEEDEEDSE